MTRQRPTVLLSVAAVLLAAVTLAACGKREEAGTGTVASTARASANGDPITE